MDFSICDHTVGFPKYNHIFTCQGSIASYFRSRCSSSQDPGPSFFSTEQVTYSYIHIYIYIATYYSLIATTETP